jgi:lipase
MRTSIVSCHALEPRYTRAEEAILTEPELLKIAARDLELAAWNWPGDGPPVVLAHATGFHARCWDEVIRHAPQRRYLSIDLRGHGESAKPLPPYRWRDFGEDIAAMLEVLGIKGALGCGHSVGGHAIALSATLRPESFSALLLVDPVIMPENRYNSHPIEVAHILRRRNQWESPQQMFESFRPRPAFAAWNENVLRDYCTYGLLPSAEGFQLACPPVVEHAIYTASNDPDANIHREIRQIQQPTLVLRSGSLMTEDKFDLATSATDPLLVTELVHGQDVWLEGRNHLIPMESPELIAEYLLRF